MGCFLQEQDHNFLKVFDGMDQYKHRYTHGKQGIQQRKIGKVHHNCADQHDHPAKYVLQHVQVYCLLVEGGAPVGKACGNKIHNYTDNGKYDHTAVVDMGGSDDPADGMVDHGGRTDQEDQGRYHAAQYGKSAGNSRKNHGCT